MTKKTTDRPDRSVKKRTPVASRNIMTTGQRDGFTRRFVNDTPGRIEMFKEAGYEPVREPTKVGDNRAGESSNMGTSVVSKNVGGGHRAILMEIPDKYYQEDQGAKERQLEKKEKSLLPKELGDAAYGEGLSISSSKSKPSDSPKVLIQ